MKDKKIKLRVAESLQDDAYRGIARVPKDIMKELGIRRGDIVSIKGDRETVAIVDKGYPADKGEEVIRIDGIIRRNARTEISKTVFINKADVNEAKKIIITPQKGIRIQGDLKPGLLGRSFVKGDLVVLGGVNKRRDMKDEDLGDINDLFGNLGDMMGGMGFGNLGDSIHMVRFAVVNISPNGVCVVGENTEVVLSGEPVEIDEEIPEVTYEDIGGLSKEIKLIRSCIEYLFGTNNYYPKMGLDPIKSILLYGHPGTGKTLFAKALANECDENFILLKGSEIMSKFYGESEKNLRDFFEDAKKNAPSIIFIDDLDLIAPKRKDSSGDVETRVMMQLSTELEKLKSTSDVLVIGATDRIDLIDPSITDPSRFEKLIEFKIPDKKARKEILEIYLKKVPIAKEVKIDKLVDMTEGFVGSKILAFIKETINISLNEKNSKKSIITLEHFNKASNILKK